MLLKPLLASAKEIGAESNRQGLEMPYAVRQLPAREREVAVAVYTLGGCTAKQVQSRLSDPISNGAVRSMLTRLVAKGVLLRRWGNRGRGNGYVYFPALTTSGIRQTAIRQLSEGYFGGSLENLAEEVSKLLHDRSSRPRRAALGD